MKVKFRVIVQFSVVALLAAACSSDPDSAGLEYMPDMYRSPAIEPYVDYGEVRGRINEDVKMRISALVPPRHTIPFWGTDSAKVHTMLPYHRLPDPSFALTHGLFGYDFRGVNNSEYTAAAADVNPIKITSKDQSEALFTKAKALYQANCNHCHGEKGDGNGPMVTAGSFTGAADLTALAIADGQMFYSIYYGKGAMGSHASLVNKEEIWTLIHYIRRFQNKDYGKFDDKGVLMSAPVAGAAPSDSTAVNP